MNLGRKFASLIGVSSFLITQLAAEEPAQPLLTALSSTTIRGYEDVGVHWKLGSGPAVPLPSLTFETEILWQHSDGRIAKWLMSGPILIQSRLVQIPSTSFPGVRTPIALDQKSIYSRHNNYLWKDGSFINVAPAIPMKDLTFAGAANFVGTQDADLIWVSRYNLMVWEIDESRVVKQHVTHAPFQVPIDAKVIGLADFNSDKSVDLLWQDPRGFVWVTLMNEIRIRGTVLLNNGRPANPKWRLRGTGEFNNDGKPDLLWQHEDGRLGTWLMNGTIRVHAALLRGGRPVGREWKVIATQTTTSYGFPRQIVRAPSPSLISPNIYVITNFTPPLPLTNPAISVYVPAVIAPPAPPTVGINTNAITVLISNTLN